MSSQTDQTAAHSELSFEQTLINSFKAQYGNQQNILNFLLPGLEGQVANPQGFDTRTLAALQTQAINNRAMQEQNAIKGAQSYEAAHSGAGLPSGVNAQIAGQIAGQSGAALQGDLTSIQQQNEQLKNQNYWRANGALSGIAEMESPTSYAGAEIGAGNAVANISQASTASDNSGFMGSLSNSFGSSLGKAAGTATSGALFGA